VSYSLASCACSVYSVTEGIEALATTRVSIRPIGKLSDKAVRSSLFLMKGLSSGRTAQLVVILPAGDRACHQGQGQPILFRRAHAVPYPSLLACPARPQPLKCCTCRQWLPRRHHGLQRPRLHQVGVAACPFGRVHSNLLPGPACSALNKMVSWLGSSLALRSLDAEARAKQTSQSRVQSAMQVNASI
jgi:hypothetical protein